MGLMSFWKKKPSEQSAVPSQDNSLLHSLNTDLPPIDGSLTDLDGSGMQQFGDMQQLPSFDTPLVPGENKSMDINMPTSDFSMPASDDAPLIDAPANPQEQSSESNTAVPGGSAKNTAIDIEDLNKLFVSDDWKEPDWSTFSPYAAEDTIDEPKPEDFKGAELPEFEDTGPMIAPTEPVMETTRFMPKPVELFIKGNAYNRVFIELDQMNKSLVKIDLQVSNYEDMLKNEEPLLVTVKEQMEYLYRKLSIIDKKIFIQ